MKTELLDAYLSGELPPELAASVEAALKEDPALRAVYFHQARLDAALRVLLREEMPDEEESGEAFVAGVMARLASEEFAGGDRQFSKSVLLEILEEREAKPRPFGWSEWITAGAVAAVAVGLLVMAMRSVTLNGSGGEGPESAERFVARVTAVEGAKWRRLSEPEAAEISPEGWMRPGSVSLESGVAEITFSSGARVFLEGPAVFELERPDRGFLQQGRLTAEVPPMAAGFVVNTPRMNVVDLGTRFGMTVEANGDSEVHVMQGTVEVSRLGGNMAPLAVTEGLAVRADDRTRSRLQSIEYRGEAYTLRVAKAPRGAAFVHYAFDESGGSMIEDWGQGLEGSPYDTSLQPEDDAPPKPKRVAGRAGGGLAFQPGECLESGLGGGFSADEAFTVALWLRLSPKAQNRGEVSVLSLGSDDHESSPALWRMTWNPDPSAGKVGALRLESGAGRFVGGQDLRDGRWHHVAMRFLGGEAAETATHVHLYIDGRLDSASGAVGGAVARGAMGWLRLGAGIGERAAAFEGWIDEVYLARDAVEPATIEEWAAGDRNP